MKDSVQVKQGWDSLGQESRLNEVNGPNLTGPVSFAPWVNKRASPGETEVKVKGYSSGLPNTIACKFILQCLLTRSSCLLQ